VDTAEKKNFHKSGGFWWPITRGKKQKNQVVKKNGTRKKEGRGVPGNWGVKGTHKGCKTKNRKHPERSGRRQKSVRGHAKQHCRMLKCKAKHGVRYKKPIAGGKTLTKKKPLNNSSEAWL